MFFTSAQSEVHLHKSKKRDQIEKLEKAVKRIKEYLVNKMPADAFINDREAFEFLFHKLKRKAINLFHVKGAPENLLEESKRLVDTLGGFFEKRKDFIENGNTQMISSKEVIAAHFSKELVKTILKRLQFHDPVTVLESDKNTVKTEGIFSDFRVIMPRITGFDDESREALLFELYKVATILTKDQLPRNFVATHVIYYSLIPFLFLAVWAFKNEIAFCQSMPLLGALFTSFSLYSLLYYPFSWNYNEALKDELSIYPVRYLLRQKLPHIALRGVIATLKDPLSLLSQSCDLKELIELLEIHGLDIEKDGYLFWKEKAALLKPEDQIPEAFEHLIDALRGLKADVSDKCNDFFERQALFAYNFLRENAKLPTVSSYKKMDKNWLRSLDANITTAGEKKKEIA